jgi:hypothetical protein
MIAAGVIPRIRLATPIVVGLALDFKDMFIF